MNSRCRFPSIGRSPRDVRRTEIEKKEQDESVGSGNEKKLKEKEYRRSERRKILWSGKRRERLAAKREREWKES